MNILIIVLVLMLLYSIAVYVWLCRYFSCGATWRDIRINLVRFHLCVKAGHDLFWSLWWHGYPLDNWGSRNRAGITVLKLN